MWRHLHNSLITNFHLVSKFLLPLLFIPNLHLLSRNQDSFASFCFALHLVDCIYKNHLFSLKFFCSLHLQKTKRWLYENNDPKSKLFFTFSCDKLKQSGEDDVGGENSVECGRWRKRKVMFVFMVFSISDWFYFWLIFNQI